MNPPLDLQYILKHLDKLRRLFTRTMLLASLLLIIVKKEFTRCQHLRMGTSLFLSNRTWMLPIVFLRVTGIQLWTPVQKVSRETIFV